MIFKLSCGQNAFGFMNLLLFTTLVCVCMCLCVCMSAPEAHNKFHNQKSSSAHIGNCFVHICEQIVSKFV